MAATRTYTKAELRRYARAFAQEHGIDPDLFERQIHHESGFNPNARSSAGALGVAQFMPATARGLGVDPLNPLQALNGAARLMADHLRQYGNWRDALTAYNAGPGAVGRPPVSETRHYIQAILGNRNPTARPVAKSAPSPTGDDETLAQQILRLALTAALYLGLVLGGAVLAGIGARRAIGAAQ